MPFLVGIINNYSNSPVSLYKTYGDTLVLVDTTFTNIRGGFVFKNGNANSSYTQGVYKVLLKKNKGFVIINDGNEVKIKTTFNAATKTNEASDSLVVLTSDNNKAFYEFIKLQQELGIANYYIMQMLRLYPSTDKFHGTLVREYSHRQEVMVEFFKKLQGNAKQSLALKLTKAYYQASSPDWKQTDQKRDSMFATNYFTYFNPADSFYMQTNVLPEKITEFLKLNNSKVDAYNQPIKDETLSANAAIQFLNNTKSNAANFEFCLGYILKKFNKEHLESAFLQVYDAYAKPQTGDCEQTTNSATLAKWLDKVNTLRNVQIGSQAPDFEIEAGRLSLSGLESKYTLLVFWATWCPHCVEEMPKIKSVINDYNQLNASVTANYLTTVAISLDTDKEPWQKYVKDYNLYQFLNYSELKGWNSEVAKKYNVYATPTLLVLDKDKKIIAKPESAYELKTVLGKLNKE